MKLITNYAPPGFSNPCLIISTVYGEKLKETAIMFIEALNGDYAMRQLYSDETEVNFIKIKSHKSLDSATKYHVTLAKKMRNGCSDEEWQKNSKYYYKLYDKYYVKGN